MRKSEKEALQAMLGDEQETIKALEKAYQRALRRIDNHIRILESDEMTQSKIYQKRYQEAMKAQINAALDELHKKSNQTIEEYLTRSYQHGYVGTMYTLHKQGMPILAPIDQRAVTRAVRTDSKLSGRLYGELGVDMQKLKKTIRREISIGISIGSDYGMIARQVQISSGIPLKRAKTIVRTEGHRIQQQSADDARNAAKAQGCQVVKQWDAVLDGNTRTDHRILDGQIREVGEPFEIDGKKAEYPGAFGRPEEDCNCRCVALTRARWALDESELQTMRDRAAFFGLDKTSSFTDFEKKYLKAAETVDKSGKSGIIVPKADGVLDLETGVRYQLVKGSKLQDVEVFAGKGSKKEFRQAEKYAQRYGGNASDWQHAKGKGMLATDEGDVKAEIHWVQCEGIGKKEMFVKEWLE